MCADEFCESVVNRQSLGVGSGSRDVGEAAGNARIQQAVAAGPETLL
jgi:hypothetical protein